MVQIWSLYLPLVSTGHHAGPSGPCRSSMPFRLSCCFVCSCSNHLLQCSYFATPSAALWFLTSGFSCKLCPSQGLKEGEGLTRDSVVMVPLYNTQLIQIWSFSSKYNGQKNMYLKQTLALTLFLCSNSCVLLWGCKRGDVRSQMYSIPKLGICLAWG